MRKYGTASRVGLSAVLLLLGLLTATQLPSTGFTGRGSATVIVAPPGRLLVSVTLNNGSAISTPMPKVRVVIAQSVLRGINLDLVTNQSGEVEFPLPTGTYEVLVSNTKFSVADSAPVSPGQLTRVQVAVNRTTYLASFVAADDSTSQGVIEPWDSVAVELSPYQLLVLPYLGYVQGQKLVIEQIPVESTPPLLNGSIFLQPAALTLGAGGPGYVYSGPEVLATVDSQARGSGATWLTLHPTSLLQLEGSSYLFIITYQAGSLVTVT